MNQLKVYCLKLLCINMIITLLLNIVIVAASCSYNQYYNTTSSVCQPCPSNCITCTSSTICSKCATAFYLQMSTCYTCQLTCKECTSPYICTACIQGFYLESSTCQLCSSNCLSCSTSSNCFKCNSGLYPENGICVSCKVSCDCSDGTLRNCPTNLFSSSSILVAIIISPILLIILLIVGCCLRKKYCIEKQQKRQKNERYKQSATTNNSLSISVGLKLIGAMLNMKKSSWTINETDQTLNQSETCSICLQNGVDLKTKCNHLFHMACLTLWFKGKKTTCPMCKSNCSKQLRKYCRKCCKNYIQCNSNNCSKFKVAFFQYCIFCQSMNETDVNFY